jgi:NDP-sugar pyrophosphorylase family protein
MEAMIFAAGLGTRLYPLTKDKPKALVEIACKTLLERCLENLVKIGCKRVVINAHHFLEKIEFFLEKKYFSLEKNNFPLEIILSKEEVLLDTGGGLKNAKKYFSLKENILIHNVDIISQIDILAMQEVLNKSNALAILAVSERKSSRQLLFNQENLLSGWQNTQTNQQIITRQNTSLMPLAFSGIHIIKPEVLELMPKEDKFPIINHYLELSKTNDLLAFKHENVFWRDLGKYEQIAEIEQQIIQNCI